MSNSDHISVIGAGTMGSGIAHVFALADHAVNLIDTSAELLENAKISIQTNLERQLKKDLITGTDSDKAMNRIKTSTEMDSAGDSALVVEAVYERSDIKKEVFSNLDTICNQDTILASNTSSISITEIASATERSDKVIGMHFFNPVPIMKLVEIVRGESTSDETFRIIRDIVEKLGKTPVEVNDSPGFISNRVLMPMINEAISALMEGVSSAEDIDRVMKLGMNHPMGPLALADYIGLDVCLNIMEVLRDGFKDSKYDPCPLLIEKVSAGELGKKSGVGFFNYN